MVKVYSTGCPRCNVLKIKLEQANIPFEIVDDLDFLIKKGFQSVPVLDTGKDLLEFASAVEWIKNNEGSCDSCSIN